MLFSMLNVEDTKINMPYKDHFCLQGPKTSEQKCLKQCNQCDNSYADIEMRKNTDNDI